MSAPSKVTVSPFVYTLREVPGLADAGVCNGDVESILYAAEMTDAQKRDTALHELLHAEFRQGLTSVLKEYDKTLEETLCAFLAPRVLSLLRDNPKLVSFLIE